LRGVFLTGEASHRAAQLTKQGKLEVVDRRDGLHLRARAHVGRVQLGPLTVTIQPKIGDDELLSLFRYAYGLKHSVRYDRAAYGTGGVMLADLLIAQLQSEVRELFEGGLARRYVRRDEELATPRGRLDFGQLARHGLHRASLPCSHHPRSTDNLLNRVVVAGLEVAASMATDRRLRADVGRQLAIGRTLARSCRLTDGLLEAALVSVNRLVRDYASILQLVRLLYDNSFTDLSEGERPRALQGFLFDMNLLWQRLLDRFLRENLVGFEVESELGLTSMMRYVPGHNPKGRKAPTPRPDFAIRQESGIVALLEAKYRDLWEKPLPREMLYQLSMYALSQGRQMTSVILFPSTEPGARSSRIEIADPGSGRAAGFIELRPVPLTDLVDLIEGDEVVMAPRKRAFARHLAFGPSQRRHARYGPLAHQ